MDLPPPAPEETDPVTEVGRLRDQLERERARRVAAEDLGERATSDLYASVRELRAAQAELMERADQSRMVTEMARALRQDLDSGQLVNRAAESVGRATGVDRCDVMLVDAFPTAAIRGTWSASAEAAALPRPDSFVDLPEGLTALMLEAAQQREPLQIDHVDEDRRLGPEAATELFESLGIRALAAVPISVGDELVGWMLLQSIVPRPWKQGELALCAGLSHDLVATLVQVQAFEQQRESVERLEELDRAKDAFISSVSHELRTPLTSIVGYLEMIAEGGMGELTRELEHGIGIIERNVVRLRALVEDLLTLSAYDASRVHLEPVPVDLASVVEECHRSLLPAMAARGVELTVECEPGLPRVLGDERHLERVVLNLLSNATKFSREGGLVRVVLAARHDPGPDGRGDVVLSVADTGIGIPAEEQDLVFSRFFRSSLSMADEIQGTGLGLALVKTVVEWHHGTVAVRSVEGEGTTVTVRLPQAF